MVLEDIDDDTPTLQPSPEEDEFELDRLIAENDEVQVDTL